MTREHRCPFDDAVLLANGFCPTGNGFPISLPYCPDVCPYCRRPLRWDGDCTNCQPPNEKPGHTYDYEPYNAKNPHPYQAHWRIAHHGPQKITGPTPEQRATLQALFTRFPTTRP